MRRIYLVVIVILLLLSFAGGYYLGSSGDSIAENTDSKAKKDSITRVIRLHQSTIAFLQRHVERQSHKIAILDSANKARTNELEKIKQRHVAPIEAVRRATIAEINVMAEKRYGSALLISDGTNYSFDSTIVKAGAIDLVKCDSIKDVAIAEADIINNLNVAVAERDTLAINQFKIIQEKDTVIASILRREVQQIGDTDFQKKETKKYKRQRNGVLAGVGAVVLAAIVKSIKSVFD